MNNIFEEDVKGTTAVAICTKDGIFGAVESRQSKEWMPKNLRTANWYPKIMDAATKFHLVAKKIICIKVGSASDCEKMMDHVQVELKPLKDNGDDIDVSHVSRIIYNYMDGLRTQNKGFGTIIAGHDDTQGFQIYRNFIKDDAVVSEQDRETAALGSGFGYANDILVFGYDFKMSETDARKLVTKAVLNGLFYDKNSGGSIHVFHVSNEACNILKRRKALNAYLENFEYYDPRHMLFLIYEIKDKNHAELLSTDHFINLFRLEGDILVAHRVDERKSHNFKFFLHRLVFTSSEDVGKVLSSPRIVKYVHKHSHAPILSKFSYKLILNGGGNVGRVEVRIEVASKALVEYMVNNCPIQNDWTARPRPRRRIVVQP